MMMPSLQKLRVIRGLPGPPLALVGSVLFIYLVFCVVFVLFVFVLCLVYPVLPLSLDFSFLIATSVLSSVYCTRK